MQEMTVTRRAETILSLRILLGIVCALLCGPLPVMAGERVVLQLKWEHEFQFAGYYAALWQGFYEAEGLEVEIRPASTPDGRLLSPVEELVAGRADFAIGALDILQQRDRGVPLVVLAPIFQRSPNSIFTLPGVPLSSLQDLAGLSIASPAGDFTRAEVQALFNASGLPRDQLHFVDQVPDLDTLLSGGAQAIATYGVSARYAAQERGVTLQELPQQALGLDFYGDTLYTHQRVVQADPERVRRFLRASLRGWEYALSHRKAIARRIATELPRHLFTYRDLEGYNLAFAAMIDSYMAWPYTEIGQNNLLRWQHMISQLHAAGVLQQRLDVRRLVFSPPGAKEPDLYLTLLLLLAGGLLTGLYLLQAERHVWQINLGCLLLLGGLLFYLEQELQRDAQRRLEVDVLRQLSAVVARLSGEINHNIARVSGMAAHIAFNPTIGQDSFARYARLLLGDDSLLNNLAAAPDLVVRMVYPLEGNRQVLGLDYRSHVEQGGLVLRLRDSSGPAVAGPLDLVQGGKAFIVRSGVQVEEGDGTWFWGILSAPILAEDLYRAGGLQAPELSVDIAIRGRDGLGASGEVFFGDGRLFSDSRNPRSTIRVGDGSWQLVAAPREGWQASAYSLWLLRGAAFGLATLLLLVLNWRQRQMQVRRRVEQQLRDNEGLLREMSRVALINGWRIAADGRGLSWSSAGCDSLGAALQPVDTLAGLLALFAEPERSRLQVALEAAQGSGEPFDLELAWEQAGQRRWLRCIGNAHWGHGSWEVSGAIQDITERKRFSEVVERQASTDLLTGLPNRSAFYETLRWALADAQRERTALALLFIDLDRFKPVNDTYGHAAGDRLLCQVAQRLHESLRDGDTVARISGDEFTVILRHVGSDAEPIDVAERLLASIRQPYELGNCQVLCGASIGIAVYPQDGRAVDELISKADYAMYEVKKSGRNGCRYFTRSMQERAEQRHRLYLHLQQAIAGRQLRVEYQPLVELASGDISRCEALVRWNCEGQNIPPAEFIALAEETSLINDIDLFVLEEATACIEALSARLGRRIGLSVNLSPRLFVSAEAALQRWLALAVDAAARVELTIEITERVLIEGPERVQPVMETLKRSGATIAIDDFGTGYSSLGYLTSLPIDYLKIDRSFVQQLDASAPEHLLVDTVIGLAKSLGLGLVAEGVESPQQLQALRARGCEYGQGYLLGMPQPADALEALLRARASADGMPPA